MYMYTDEEEQIIVQINKMMTDCRIYRLSIRQKWKREMRNG